MLGIKGDFKIGIGGKLQASGAYGLAAMAGGGLTTGIRNSKTDFLVGIILIKIGIGEIIL